MWCDIDRASQESVAGCYDEHDDRTSNVVEIAPVATKFGIGSCIRRTGAASVQAVIDRENVLEEVLQVSQSSVRSVESPDTLKTGFLEAMSAVIGLSGKAEDKVSFEKKFMKTISKSKTLRKASEVIDSLISNDLLFNDIDKRMVLKDLSEVFDEMSTEQIELSGNMLQETMKGILVGYAASNVFDDLTPTQKQQFERATKRGSLLK